MTTSAYKPSKYELDYKFKNVKHVKHISNFYNLCQNTKTNGSIALKPYK
jgi:hypothetical protein